MWVTRVDRASDTSPLVLKFRTCQAVVIFVAMCHYAAIAVPAGSRIRKRAALSPRRPTTFFRQDAATCLIPHKPFLSPHQPFAEVEMAKKQTRSRAEQTRPSADRLTHPLLEK